MRKNKMMRVAILLMVAVLLTTCVISGTFAKYVTSGTSQSTARVAKFGVEVQATSDLFTKTYKNGSETVTVASSNNDNVVAPGTSGTISNATLKGKPEVAVQIGFAKPDFEIGDNWTVGTGDSAVFYCPLIITVNGTSVKGLDYTSASDFEAAVEAKITAITTDVIVPNTDLSGKTDGLGINVGWEWPFETSNDEKDTALGDAAAAGTAITVSLSYDVTVTQVD